MLKAILYGLSRQKKVAQACLKIGLIRRFAHRFIAGETREDALNTAQALNKEGFRTTLNFLGEFISSPEEAQAALKEYQHLLREICERKLNSTIAVKLTQLGLTIDKNLTKRLLSELLDTARSTDTFFRIDMENSSYVDATLELYREFAPEYSRFFGIVLQSTLYRTEKDLENLLPLGPNIRLVKGAYLEPPDVAFPKKKDVDANYRRLMERMLSNEEMRNSGFLAIATHDETILREVEKKFRSNQFPLARAEFQFLYGIRRDLHQAMKSAGFPVRIYIPYGPDWYAYFMRRLAERPANIWFFLRHLFR